MTDLFSGPYRQAAGWSCVALALFLLYLASGASQWGAMGLFTVFIAASSAWEPWHSSRNQQLWVQSMDAFTLTEKRSYHKARITSLVREGERMLVEVDASACTTTHFSYEGHELHRETRTDVTEHLYCGTLDDLLDSGELARLQRLQRSGAVLTLVTEASIRDASVTPPKVDLISVGN